MSPFSLIYCRHRYSTAKLLFFSSSFAQLEDSAHIPLAVDLIRVWDCSKISHVEYLACIDSCRHELV